MQSTTVGFATYSIKNTELVHVTLEPITIIAIQPLHLLLGICGFIIFFLFIIIMKRRKEFINLKGQRAKRQSSDDNAAQGESSDINDHRCYDDVSEQFIDHPYRSIEVHYAEIDESLQLSILDAPNSSTGNEQDAGKSIERKVLPIDQGLGNTIDKVSI